MSARATLADPLLWAAAAFCGLLAGLPYSKPFFAWIFPELPRPLYEQNSFFSLVLAHLALVAAASATAAVIAISAGILVCQPMGREFRPLVETLAAMAQNVPPVAVLAIAVPLIGFGFWPAYIALALYALLPIVQTTITGLEQVPPAVREAAAGMGMTGRQRLTAVDLPLATPLILAGLRTAVIVNVGTAAIASTVGARTLGTPIILGLTGSNTAYVIQGALILGALAVLIDLCFDRLSAALTTRR